MAKRHSHRRSRRSIIRVGSSKPVVIRTTKIVKSKRHHRHSGGGGALGGFLNKGRLGIAAGALAAGFVRKQFPNIPELPFVGEMGTIAIGAYFLGGGRNQFLNELCTAALAIGAYELGNTGHVVGDDGIDYMGF